MDFSIVELVKAFGPSGLFIAFLIWEAKHCREDRQKFITFIERMAERER